MFVQVYHSHNMTSIHDRCLSNIPVMRTLLYREAIYKFHLVWFCWILCLCFVSCFLCQRRNLDCCWQDHVKLVKQVETKEQTTRAECAWWPKESWGEGAPKKNLHGTYILLQTVFQKNMQLHGASPRCSNLDVTFIAPVCAVLCPGDKFISNYHTSGNRRHRSCLVIRHL